LKTYKYDIQLYVNLFLNYSKKTFYIKIAKKHFLLKTLIIFDVYFL